MTPVKPDRNTRKSKTAIPTQQYLDILEIRDDTVVLKDGTLRAVLLVSSINFSLKSEEEQDAVIEAYTQFLNTIDYPLQIVIQSRRLDIDEYLQHLQTVEQAQTNELLKLQTRDYRQFVAELVQIADIMTKRFYIVIPYAPKIDRPGKFFGRLFDTFSPTATIHLKQKQFDEFRTELFKRVDNTMNALDSAGLKSVILDTQSLIELYYNSYNPETSDKQKLQNVEKVNLEEVSSIKQDEEKRR